MRLDRSGVCPTRLDTAAKDAGVGFALDATTLDAEGAGSGGLATTDLASATVAVPGIGWGVDIAAGARTEDDGFGGTVTGERATIRSDAVAVAGEGSVASVGVAEGFGEESGIAEATVAGADFAGDRGSSAGRFATASAAGADFTASGGAGTATRALVAIRSVVGTVAADGVGSGIEVAIGVAIGVDSGDWAAATAESSRSFRVACVCERSGMGGMAAMAGVAGTGFAAASFAGAGFAASWGAGTATRALDAIRSVVGTGAGDDVGSGIEVAIGVDSGDWAAATGESSRSFRVACVCERSGMGGMGAMAGVAGTGFTAASVAGTGFAASCVAGTATRAWVAIRSVVGTGAGDGVGSGIEVAIGVDSGDGAAATAESSRSFRVAAATGEPSRRFRVACVCERSGMAGMAAMAGVAGTGFAAASVAGAGFAASWGAGTATRALVAIRSVVGTGAGDGVGSGIEVAVGVDSGDGAAATDESSRSFRVAAATGASSRSFRVACDRERSEFGGAAAMVGVAGTGFTAASVAGAGFVGSCRAGTATRALVEIRSVVGAVAADGVGSGIEVAIGVESGVDSGDGAAATAESSRSFRVACACERSGMGGMAAMAGVAGTGFTAASVAGAGFA
ncbi:MAG: hypothetical protein ACKO38_18085, partial [Planctomycetota bacterium]